MPPNSDATHTAALALRQDGNIAGTSSGGNADLFFMLLQTMTALALV